MKWDVTCFPVLYTVCGGYVFTCRARDTDYGNESFLALLWERAVIFTFLSWKQGKREKGGRGREKQCVSVCLCVWWSTGDAEGSIEYGDYADGKWVTPLGVYSRPAYRWEKHRLPLSSGLKPNQVTQRRLWLYYREMKCILNVCSRMNYAYFTVQYVFDGTFN